MHLVIMAGGSGTRFWPASRRAHPKQFLAIASEQPMLAQAVANALASPNDLDQVLVVAGRDHRPLVALALPGLPAANGLYEPCGRNTAPAIGLACVHIARRDPNAVVAVLPSDHVILKREAFRQALAAAGEAALGGAIVTIGIAPTRPETGYGYIRCGAELSRHGDFAVQKVQAFVEKPALAVAEGYLRDGGYLWNAGMFVFRAQVMLDAIAALMPDLHQGLATIAAAVGTGDEQRVLDEVYPRLPAQSIDYGVMEKAHQVAVVPADIGWSDVGSWAALDEVLPHDAAHNVTRGDTLLVDSQHNVVDARAGRLVALVGCQELCVVDSADAVLVLPKARAQDVRQVLARLEQQQRSGLL